MGFLKGIRKYKVRGIMGLGGAAVGWGSLRLACMDQVDGDRLLQACDNLKGKLRERQVQISEKCLRDAREYTGHLCRGLC